MSAYCKYDWHLLPLEHTKAPLSVDNHSWRKTMKTWSKPEVREQEVGLEVTSYLPAEIDLI